MDATCGTGIAYRSEASGSTPLPPVFRGIRVARSLVFFVMYCTALSVLRFTFAD